VKYPSQKQVFTELGKKIVALRHEHKLSQADLAYEADIDLSSLSRLERGNVNVTVDTLYKIAKVLKVEIKDLF
jgi:transcriptional regulator with XRE-family HTH domain